MQEVFFILEQLSYLSQICIICFIDLDRHDLMIYEEVGEMPPFQRSVIIIIGAQGVGRRTLKNRLIKANPKNFSTITPCKCQSVFNQMSLIKCLGS